MDGARPCVDTSNQLHRGVDDTGQPAIARRAERADCEGARTSARPVEGDCPGRARSGGGETAQGGVVVFTRISWSETDRRVSPGSWVARRETSKPGHGQVH